MAKELTAGIVAFHISAQIDVSQMGDMPPEQITAFFDGIAKVVAASNGTHESIEVAEETTE